MPRIANVVANPNANAMESPTIWQEQMNQNSIKEKMKERERELQSHKQETKDLN